MYGTKNSNSKMIQGHSGGHHHHHHHHHHHAFQGAMLGGAGVGVGPNNSSSAAMAAAMAEAKIPKSKYKEKATKLTYEHATKTWKRTPVMVSIAKAAFDQGGTRQVYKMFEYDGEGNVSMECVAKFLDQVRFNQNGIGPITKQMYFDDAMTQIVAQHYADMFNAKNPPKEVRFLDAWVLELSSRPGQPLCNVEPMLKGAYLKHNNNDGGTFSSRHTPQAFSHFTYEASKHKMLVCDIQGVDDHYTDPQVHTRSGKGFGLGNQGIVGFNKFLASHTCNPLCQQVGLPRLKKGLLVPPKSSSSSSSSSSNANVSNNNNNNNNNNIVQNIKPAPQYAAPAVPPQIQRQSSSSSSSSSAASSATTQPLVGAVLQPQPLSGAYREGVEGGNNNNFAPQNFLQQQQQQHLKPYGISEATADVAAIRAPTPKVVPAAPAAPGSSSSSSAAVAAAAIANRYVQAFHHNGGVMVAQGNENMPLAFNANRSSSNNGTNRPAPLIVNEVGAGVDGVVMQYSAGSGREYSDFLLEEVEDDPSPYPLPHMEGLNDAVQPPPQFIPYNNNFNFEKKQSGHHHHYHQHHQQQQYQVAVNADRRASLSRSSSGPAILSPKSPSGVASMHGALPKPSVNMINNNSSNNNAQGVYSARNVLAPISPPTNNGPQYQPQRYSLPSNGANIAPYAVNNNSNVGVDAYDMSRPVSGPASLGGGASLAAEFRRSQSCPKPYGGNEIVDYEDDPVMMWRKQALLQQQQQQVMPNPYQVQQQPSMYVDQQQQQQQQQRAAAGGATWREQYVIERRVDEHGSPAKPVHLVTLSQQPQGQKVILPDGDLGMYC